MNEQVVKHGKASLESIVVRVLESNCNYAIHNMD